MTVIELLKAKATFVVEKQWGTEYWLTNTEKYCLKLLQLEPGYQSSLHYHNIKDEQFLTLSGDVNLELGAQGTLLMGLHILLRPGDSRRLKPGRIHRFSAAGNLTAYVLEVSTRHEDSDVVRLEPSRRIYNEPDSPIS